MTGHLFVVHGRIEDLRRDVALIPVDSEFRIEAHWYPLLDRNPRPEEGWQSAGWTRVGSSTPVERSKGPVYAVSIGDGFDGYDRVVERLEGCLSSLAERRATLRRRRGTGTLPLVAVPVIGIGAGGFGDDRGGVLEALVAALHRAARNHGLDIALVTPESSVYSAAQYARRKQPTDLPPALESDAQRLGKLARAGKLALFTGAGVSIPAGLPSWHQLVQELAKKFGVIELGSSKAPLTALDQAQLIEIAAKDSFQQEIAKRFKSRHRPSLVHGLLAGLDSREVVTTNYDLLYERAVRATGRMTSSVMPWQSALESDRWILKLHGDAADEASPVRGGVAVRRQRPAPDVRGRRVPEVQSQR